MAFVQPANLRNLVQQENSDVFGSPQQWAAYTQSAATPAPQVPGDQLNATQQNAFDYLNTLLADYGLSALAGFVKTEIINGSSPDRVALDMRQTPEFKQRFPAIEQRRQQGLPPISPAEYLALERSYTQLEREAGLPVGFTDKSHTDSLIAGDVSPTEYASRINEGYLAASQAPQETRDMLHQYYGMDTGHLAAYFLDPNKALPLLKQQVQAAQVGGAAARTGFGDVSQAQAERLAQLGVTAGTAQTGFENLFHMRQLEGTLPGQAQTALTGDQLLGAQFGGNEQVKEVLQRRADEQKALFQGESRFAETQAGVEGVGQVVR